jgi:mRNA-degrading endonuclease RelE of RelBE toxin-antitoxin system
METRGFDFHRRAFMALGELSESEQAAIRERLEALSETPPRDWHARVVRRAGVATPLYLIRIDDSLRVLIAAFDGRAPQVVDIVRHETLQHFATSE